MYILCKINKLDVFVEAFQFSNRDCNTYIRCFGLSTSTKNWGFSWFSTTMQQSKISRASFKISFRNPIRWKLWDRENTQATYFMPPLHCNSICKYCGHSIICKKKGRRNWISSLINKFYVACSVACILNDAVISLHYQFLNTQFAFQMTAFIKYDVYFIVVKFLH